MSILVICEKPSQARDIARNLKAHQREEGYLSGNNYQVTWCIGHLLELAPVDYYQPNIKPWRIEKLPVIPEKWEMVVSQRTKKQFTIIKRLLKQTKHVIIATDADREGEVIAREILALCGYQGKVERLWLSALDDNSIQKALKQIKLGTDTEKLYIAGLGRQRADWLMGMNMTMAMSSLYGIHGMLSVGRVQTPTLKLVVDRDYSIENFKSQNYFILKALFVTQKQEEVWTIWQPSENILDENGHCLAKSTVENIAAKVEGEPGEVQTFKEEQKKQSAPLCFSLSSLQKKASALFGYSAKQVLELVQSLYEVHKAVTYPRTDSGYLPQEQWTEAFKILDALVKADNKLKAVTDVCDIHFKSPAWNDKKVTAHHAIIPTANLQVDINKMSKAEFSIYDLIRRQYLAQFLGDYEYLQRQLEILCVGEKFTATCRIPIKPGWKQVFKETGSVGDDESDENIILPILNKGQTVENQKILIESKQTKPPARFTEGTLIDAMKTVGKFVVDENLRKILKDSNGIGTEATRANILEILFKRGYLQRQGKQVISTEKGRTLINLVPDTIKNPVLTAQWEQQLDQIAQGSAELNTFVASQVKILNEMLMQLSNEKNLQMVQSPKTNENIRTS